LQLHPLEMAILDRLRESSEYRSLDNRRVPVLTSADAVGLAQGRGYRDEETLLALQLLAARGYSRFDVHDKIVYLAQLGPDPVELQDQLERIAQDLASVPAELLPEDQLSSLRSELSNAREHLEEASHDEEELDELQTRLSDLDRKLRDALSEKREELRRQLSNLVLEVERALIGLRQSDRLDREIQGQVAFVMHLNELRQQLATERRRLAEENSSTNLRPVGGWPSH
jgi:hypothetical protein